MQRSLVILKPDAVQRGLVGQIVGRFEAKGLKLAAMKMMQISRELAERHYGVHRGKDFYPPLIDYITSAPVVVMVLEGAGAVDVVRRMMGTTFGYDAEPGTIRGDLGLSRRLNLVHGSDSPEAADKEIPLFFSPGEVLDYRRDGDGWIYDMSGPDPV
jgi:nucleoside-diphosphate kinase